MATKSQYNLKSPAVKRIMKEAAELSLPTEDYFAQPLEENLFEWHFTIRGPADSCFQKGIYHGKILLPTSYPLSPPAIILLTPNGRFQTNKKICLTISGHHPETWLASWSIRTILLALIGFMPSEGMGTIGSLEYSSEERMELAKKSLDWQCNVCGKVCDLLKERVDSTDNKKDADINKLDEKDRELLKRINFKADVEQQTTVNNSNIVKKIDNLDDNHSNETNQHTQDQQERLINEITNQNNNLNNTQSSLNNSTTTTTPTINNSNLLTRISPKYIIIMIIILLIRRLYITFY